MPPAGPPQQERRRPERCALQGPGILANVSLVWIVTFSKYSHTGSRLIIAIRLFAHSSPRSEYLHLQSWILHIYHPGWGQLLLTARSPLARCRCPLHLCPTVLWDRSGPSHPPFSSSTAESYPHQAPHSLQRNRVIGKQGAPLPWANGGRRVAS
jgi:hypothetical protein